MITKHFKAKVIKGKIIADNPRLLVDKLILMEGKEILITIDKWTKKRTLQQNAALHLWFTQLARELNEAGYDMRKLISKEIDIPWSAISVKEYLWRPVQKVHLKKKSTTRLTTTEIDQIYDIVNKVIAERTGIHVPFPSIEELFHD